jgi:hypothetical protein
MSSTILARVIPAMQQEAAGRMDELLGGERDDR